MGTLITVERDVPCPMRDGTILRGDLYRSGDGDPSPVLVHRTPYGKMHPSFVTSLMIHPFEAVESGYAVYVQDVRGRFNSDGCWEPLHCERDDGFDTVEWAAQQSWSNGQVGVYGSSYMGVTALQAAAARPPHLSGVVTYLTGANYYDGWVYSGGALELLFILRWCAGQAMDTLRRAGMSATDSAAARERLVWILDHPDQACRFRPLIDVFGAADALVSHWRKWLEHPHYDSFWAATDPLPILSQVNIPILSIAGWYDGFLKGHLDLHEALSKPRPTTQASGDEELILGPWDHEAYLSLRPTMAGDASFGVHAMCGQPGLSKIILDWFDRRLDRAAPSGAAPSRVRYFVMGANEWCSSESWPPSCTTMHRLFLGGSSANSGLNCGQLQEKTPANLHVWTVMHDPANPVPTVGGRHLGYWYGHAGVRDQSTVETRPDVLVFTGDELTETLTLAGRIRANLWVRFDAQSADFAAKLVDVRPDGYCANIAEGILRVSQPNGAERQAEQEIVIDLWHSAYAFQPGHRIRLEIAGSNFPRFDVSDGLPVGCSIYSEAPASPFKIAVLAGGQWPSYIMLDVLKSLLPER